MVDCTVGQIAIAGIGPGSVILAFFALVWPTTHKIIKGSKRLNQNDCGEPA